MTQCPLLRRKAKLMAVLENSDGRAGGVKDVVDTVLVGSKLKSKTRMYFTNSFQKKGKLFSTHKYGATNWRLSRNRSPYYFLE